MTSEQLDRWASEIRRRDNGTTHWDGCEESHPRCRELALIARVRELEADRDRLAAEVERQKVALCKVRAHTAYTVPREGTLTDLLAGLLASIERITNAALAEAPTPARTHVFDRPTEEGQ